MLYVKLGASQIVMTSQHTYRTVDLNGARYLYGLPTRKVLRNAYLNNVTHVHNSIYSKISSGDFTIALRIFKINRDTQSQH